MTMDEIDTFKVKALDNLATTITALESELDKSKSYLSRSRAQSATEAEAGDKSPKPQTGGPFGA
jgi:hypothetical protein